MEDASIYFFNTVKAFALGSYSTISSQKSYFVLDKLVYFFDQKDISLNYKSFRNKQKHYKLKKKNAVIIVLLLKHQTFNFIIISHPCECVVFSIIPYFI